MSNVEKTTSRSGRERISTRRIRYGLDKEKKQKYQSKSGEKKRKKKKRRKKGDIFISKCKKTITTIIPIRV